LRPLERRCVGFADADAKVAKNHAEKGRLALTAVAERALSLHVVQVQRISVCLLSVCRGVTNDKDITTLARRSSSTAAFVDAADAVVAQAIGAASTISMASCARKLAAQPVFAVVSGLAGKSWAPVHAFCERSAVPCLFPNVEAPPAGADRDFYSLYFSRGVLLEADLIAKAMLEGEGAPRRVLQVYRAGDSGEAGALALSALLRQHGVAVSSHALGQGAPAASVAQAMRRTTGEAAIVLWLRAPELATLAAEPPARAAVYVSGLLGGLERATLPPQWRGRTRIAYPVDLPERRRVRVDYALGWFTIRHIPIVAEQVQADTYLACGLLSETLQHMIDNFVPEYLIERIEDTVEHRVVTGYYPRLTLGTGQRYASKGGYVVHFSEPRGTHLIADHEWVVP